jgi:hypothetical protein
MTIELGTAEKENFQTPRAALAQHPSIQDPYPQTLREKKDLNPCLTPNMSSNLYFSASILAE